MADDDSPDILDEHRYAVVDRQNDVADVFQGLQAAQATDVVELPALRVEAASSIAVVGRESGDDRLNRKACAGDPGGIEQDLVLHRLPAEAGIVGDARDGLVLPLHDPVFDRLQLLWRTVRALQDVAIHEAGRGEERRNRWGHVGGQRGSGETFEDLLSGEVVVRSVCEAHPDV